MCSLPSLLAPWFAAPLAAVLSSTSSIQSTDSAPLPRATNDELFLGEDDGFMDMGGPSGDGALVDLTEAGLETLFESFAVDEEEVLPPPAPQELSPAKAQQQELCAALDGLPESMQKMLVTQLLSNITCLQAANLAACSPSPSCSSPPPTKAPAPPPTPAAAVTLPLASAALGAFLANALGAADAGHAGGCYESSVAAENRASGAMRAVTVEA